MHAARPRLRSTLQAVTLVALALLGAVIDPIPLQARESSALWRVVHDLCVPDLKLTGAPAPCAAVDLARGYAVVSDVINPSQVLLVPIRRSSGIDDAALLTPQSPNYWQAAWEARLFVERRIGRPIPRDDLGLAINSRYSRSQNQLHIHVDCVQPEVQAALKADADAIGAQWSEIEVGGRPYRAMRLEGDDLGSRDPFKLLAEADAQARADMGRETLVVIGVTAPDDKAGFVVLSDRADMAAGDRGWGEELLDHRCKVLAAR